MTSILNKVSKSPLYYQVAQIVKQRVKLGYYHHNKPLPSVRTLREEFGVSLTVIQRAMRHLEEEGVVSAHHGKNITLTPDSNCDQTAILFGFIHPFAGTLEFRRDVLDYADRTFADRHNCAVVRSSNDNPNREREIAQHFILNGIKGLLLWPASDNPNGSYFSELAKEYPVALVDRTLAGADLPAVIYDTHKLGQEIVTRILGSMKKQHLLVIVDNLKISTYDNLVLGVQQQAGHWGRMADVTIVYLPISQAIEQLTTGDFGLMDSCAEQIRRLLAEGKYDAVFCTQDDLIEYAIIDTNLLDEFPHIQLATMGPVGNTKKSRKFHRCNPIKWRVNLVSQVSQAVDLLQRWLLSRQKPKSIILTHFSE